MVRSSRKWLVGVLLALTIVFAGGLASATVMLYLDLARLVELSDVVVQGTMVDQKTVFDEQRQQHMLDTTFEVDHVFYGDGIGETVTFRQWGGEFDGKTAHIPGDAVFDPYEQAVVFLVDGKGKFAGGRYLTALGQSKFTIVHSNGEAIVARDLSGLVFTQRDGTDIEHRPRETWSHASFVAELESLVAGIKGGSK